MVEKFNLTWSNYQAMISRSFSKLRNETDLSDVTLICDDQEYIAAHRVVLSTCSEFFKRVFHHNVQRDLALYLSDMKSKEVNQILDYIYFGEINILQDDLERFIEIAQKLKLEGLGDRGASKQKEEVMLNNTIESQYQNMIDESGLMTNPNSEFSESSPSENKNVVLGKRANDEIGEISYPVVQTQEKKYGPTYRPPAFESEVDVEKLDQKIKEFTSYGRKKCSCKLCGKELFGRNRNQNMADHIETHIEGLSFKCQCGKMYRTRNLLRSHKLKYCNRQPMLAYA